ncbi:hypothetical protein [Paenibacillus sp. y28]|uniref:hypothetical protein n=1 Tax=Paenibacillus sp. y28 TaxID=3129110 RepID=UPI0030183DBD
MSKNSPNPPYTKPAPPAAGTWRHKMSTALAACLLFASLPAQALAGSAQGTNASQAAGSSVVSSAIQAELSIGDDIGDVLATDIKAYVNGAPIRSMNIDGYTAIVAEDLRQYGFDVVWTAADRKVAIYNRPAKQMETPEALPDTKQPVGTKTGDVLYTNLKAYYGSKQIPSYNIGGQTAIRLNDLEDAGIVKWDAQARTISFTSEAAEAPDSPPMDQVPLVLHQQQETQITGILIGEENVTYNGKTIGRIKNGQPMISLAFAGEALGYQLNRKQRYRGCGEAALCLDNSVFGLEVYPSNAASAPEQPLRVTLYWMGGENGVTSVSAMAADSETDVLVSENDLQSLFGYSSSWDPEMKILDIRYTDYTVDDYGLPKELKDYYYVLEAAGYMAGDSRVMPGLVLKSLQENVSGFSTEAALVGEAGAYEYNGQTGLSRYAFKTNLQFDNSSVYYELQMKAGQRILYSTAFEYAFDYQTMNPVIPYPDPASFGSISRIHMDAPSKGYIETAEDEVMFSGKVLEQVGPGLTVVIQQQVYGGHFETVEERTVPFEGGQFLFRVPVSKDPRYMTKVIIKSTVAFPRGMTQRDVARFYIQKW